MDVEDKLLIQRLQDRASELEHWLAMLVIESGRKTGSGFRYSICDEHAQAIRARMHAAQPVVSVEYDVDRDRHIIDVI